MNRSAGVAVVAGAYFWLALNNAFCSVVLLNVLLEGDFPRIRASDGWKVTFMINLVVQLVLNRYLFGLAILILVCSFCGLVGLVLAIGDWNQRILIQEP